MSATRSQVRHYQRLAVEAEREAFAVVDPEGFDVCFWCHEPVTMDYLSKSLPGTWVHTWDHRVRCGGSLTSVGVRDLLSKFGIGGQS